MLIKLSRITLRQYIELLYIDDIYLIGVQNEIHHPCISNGIHCSLSKIFPTSCCYFTHIFSTIFSFLEHNYVWYLLVDMLFEQSIFSFQIQDHNIIGYNIYVLLGWFQEKTSINNVTLNKFSPNFCSIPLLLLWPLLPSTLILKDVFK